MMEEQEKVEKARKPKVKKGRGRNARKKTKKVNSNSAGDTEADGYEVDANRLLHSSSISTSYVWQLILGAVGVTELQRYEVDAKVPGEPPRSHGNPLGPREPPCEGFYETGVGETCEKRRFSRTKSLYLGNDRTQAHSYNERLMGMHMWTCDWYQLHDLMNDRNAPLYTVYVALSLGELCRSEYRQTHTVSLQISAVYGSYINLQGE